MSSSNLNFRNFADQIFGFSNKFLNEFIIPEIKKEEFSKNFKEGFLLYNDVKLKKRNEIKLNSFLILDFFEIKELNAIIPNETINLDLKLKNTKIYLKFLEFSNKIIENLLLINKKKSFENFVNYIKNKILKKGNNLSFIENLIQNLLNKLIDGMKIFFDNLEIYFECKNFIFKIQIESINYDELNGIFIKNLNFSVKNNHLNNFENTIFNNLNCKIEIFYKNNEIEFDNNKIIINIENFDLNFNKNIFLSFKNVFEFFNYFKYKKIECKFKKIIEYFKPKNLNKKQKWIYAKNLIKKIKDFQINKNFDVFKISFEEENKIINEFLNNENNNNNNENLIFVHKINLFSLSKNYIENKIIEEKKKNFLNFFGGKNNELKEEEKNDLNNFFKDKNFIENCLKNKDYNNNNNNNFIEKIKNFFKFLQIIININSINLHFKIETNNNNNNIINLTFNKSYLNLIFHNKEIKTEFKLNDIFENNLSILNKNNNNLNCVDFNIDNNNNININFGFETINLKDSFIFQMIYYIFYFKKEFFYKVFKKQDLKKINNNNNENFNENNSNFLDKIKFSHIPNLTIIHNNNEKINFNLNNLNINNNQIEFNLKIENFINYYFIISKQINNKNKSYYLCNLNNPINIYINSSLINLLTNLYFIISFANDENVNFMNENEDNFYFNFNNKIKAKNFNLLFKISNLNLHLEEESKLTSYLNVCNLELKISENYLNVQIEKVFINTFKNSVFFYLLLNNKYSPIKNFNTLNLIPEKFEQIKKNENKKNFFEFIIKYYFKINSIINKITLNLLDNNIIFQMNFFYIKSEIKTFLLKIKINSIKISLINENEKKESIICKLNENNENSENIIKISFLFYINLLFLDVTHPIIKLNLTMILFLMKFFTFKKKQKKNYFNDKNYYNINNYYDINNINDNNNNNNNLNFKINMNLNKIEFNFSSFNAYLESFKFVNYNNNNNNNNDLMLLKFINIIVQNSKKINILYEKELHIKLNLSQKKESSIFIQSFNINANINQSDLYKMIIFSDKKFIDYLNYNNNNNNEIKIDKNIIIDEDEENSNDFLNIEILVSNLNLYLNLENQKKLGEINIKNTKLIYKNLNYIIDINNPKNILNENFFDFFINKINLKYLDINNKEVQVISTNNNNNNNNKNIINQLEIKKDNNNNYNININGLNIVGRFDSFLCLYKYFYDSIPKLNEIKLINKFNLNNNNNNNIEKNFYLNFINSQIFVQTNYDASQYLKIFINDLKFSYLKPFNKSFPFGSNNIQSSFVKLQLITNNKNNNDKNIREILFTDEKKNIININTVIEENSFNIFGEINIINMIILYTDIISILKAYQLNKFFLKIENRINDEKFFFKSNNFNNNNNNFNNNNNNIFQIQNLKKIKGEINFNKLEITLIENSTNSYFPFMNLILSKLNFIINENFYIQSVFDFNLNSYNYLARCWEPMIENVNIILNLKYLSQCVPINININDLYLNLCDMNISFILVCFNKWIENFTFETKKYEEFINNNINHYSISNYTNNIDYNIKNNRKISNNKFINNSGNILQIVHNNKKYNCEPLKEIELEYSNNNNSKQIQIYYNNETYFNFNIERLGAREQKINQYFYFIMENTLSKERIINTSIYSPIIFKNKTNENINVILENKNNGQFYLILYPNNKLGIPLNFFDNQTSFYFSDGTTLFSSKYFLKDILNLQQNSNFKTNINLTQKILTLKLLNNIPKVKELVIFYNYSIVNCCPFDINICLNNNKYLIDKCTQFNIQFTYDSPVFYFELLICGEIFKTKNKKWFEKQHKKNGTFIKFTTNQNLNMRLSMMNNKNEYGNQLIVFAESIIKNNTGIKNLEIISKNKDSLLVFSIYDSTCFVMTSKIDFKNAFFKLKVNNLISKKIDVEDLYKNSKMKILLKNENNNNNNFNNNEIYFVIKSKLSNINIWNNNKFNVNIMTKVFNIISICNIINLLQNKNFYIKDDTSQNNYILIKPNSHSSFNYFNKSPNLRLRFSIAPHVQKTPPSFWTEPFVINKYGILTYNLNGFYFNIEIRNNSTISNLFTLYVTEASIEKCKISLENKTSKSIVIYQKNYENKFTQIIEPNQNQILTIFDQNYLNFYLILNDKTHQFNFYDFNDEEKQISIDNEIVLFTESNGIKKNFSFYEKNKINFNKFSNFSISINFNINSIGISFINDNENVNKKLRNYNRNEIIYVYLNNILNEMKIEINKGILNKKIYSFNVAIDLIEIYNLIYKNCKFFCVLKNEIKPFLKFHSSVIQYENNKIFNIKQFNLFFNKINIGIDPDFIVLIMNFISNIIYRMNILNFNVDEIFQYRTNNNNYLEKYYNDAYLFICSNLKIPELNIVFQITDYNLESFLKKYLGFSSFYYFFIKRLTKDKNKINLNSQNINYFNGRIHILCNQIIDYYKSKAIDKMGKTVVEEFFKGIFKEIIGNNKKTDFYITGSINRGNRPFFGKFKFFTNYNEKEAKIYSAIKKKHPIINNNYNFSGLVIGINLYFLFTTISLFIIHKNSFENFGNIDYFYISNVLVEGKEIFLEYSQKIEGNNNCKISCEDENVALDVQNMLKDQIMKNSGEIYYLN